MKFVLHTSIASEIPGIDVKSPPITLSVKSRHFCSHKTKEDHYNKTAKKM